jgi:hypothetical protein
MFWDFESEKRALAEASEFGIERELSSFGKAILDISQSSERIFPFLMYLNPLKNKRLFDF